MDTTKLLSRLGIVDAEEFLKLIDTSDRGKLMKRLLKEDSNISIGQICKLLIPSFDGNDLELTYSNQDISEVNYYRKGYAVILRSAVVSETIPRRKNLPNPEKFPQGNIPKRKSDWYFHKGHILGHLFQKYILNRKIIDISFKDLGEWSNNRIDDIRNLIVQFDWANKRQSEVENRVEKLLVRGIDVFYEVKAVYRKNSGKKDVYPIGVEIFYLPIESGASPVHYFIPNIDESFVIDENSNNSQVDYFQFYKDGFTSDFKEYFKEVWRNSYQLCEEISFEPNEDEFYILLTDKNDDNKDNGIYFQIDNENISRILDENKHRSITVVDFSEKLQLETLNQIQIIKFKSSDIVAVDWFLRKNRLVKRNANKNFYFPVENHPQKGSAIFFKYGNNEGHNIRHKAKKTLDESFGVFKNDFRN